MTDYTNLTAVKRALGSQETADDVLLAELITQASRAIDRQVASADNYFAREILLEVMVSGHLTAGNLLCHLPKPVVESVQAFAYRESPEQLWKMIDPHKLLINGYSVTTGLHLAGFGKVQVQTSFTGGYDPLPGDLVNLATLLSIRFYREVKSGLGDSIGVAELGTLTYTKAFPARLVEMLKPYKRVC